MTSRPSAAAAFQSIVGRDPALQLVLARAARVAPTRTPVLVTGESGTGKELVARALHDLGPAARGPFVAVNCGALSRELVESELFGHERGAFTGAAPPARGLFEEADGGTLFLDEIGELPLELQAKLLRVLETREVRAGRRRPARPVDVRVVAATNRDLRREVAARAPSAQDLYYRLNGRSRIDAAAAARAARATSRCSPSTSSAQLGASGGDAARPPPAALDASRRYDWPGNVRELRNVIRRAAILVASSSDPRTWSWPRPASAGSASARLRPRPPRPRARRPTQ